MARYTLIVGTRNWSSWSLRPFVALKATGAPFEVIDIRLRQTEHHPTTKEQILTHSPAGKVPILKIEEGGESRAPLAVVVMGGVLSSTLLTLVLVPSVYTILDDAKVGLASLRQRLRSLGRRAPAPAHGVSVARASAVPPPVRGGAED